MYEKNCKWCKKIIIVKNQQSFASHVSYCEMNPNLKNRLFSLSSKFRGKNKVERIKLNKMCPKCGLEFELEVTEAQIKRNKIRNYCSLKCANSHNKTEDQKKKISEINKNSKKVKEANRKIGIERLEKHKNSGKYKFICMKCGIEGENKRWTKQKYHKECWISISGGIRQGSSNCKCGWYKGYWCDSSYELAYLIFNLEQNINIKRNKKGFEYLHEGEKHLFYPDFIVNGEYVEIKNYKSKLTDNKLKYFPHRIKIYYKDTIAPFIDYAIKQYGKNFISEYNKMNNNNTYQQQQKIDSMS